MGWMGALAVAPTLDLPMDAVPPPLYYNGTRLWYLSIAGSPSEWIVEEQVQFVCKEPRRLVVFSDHV